MPRGFSRIRIDVHPNCVPAKVESDSLRSSRQQGHGLIVLTPGIYLTQAGTLSAQNVPDNE
jgi:hypothetical protein